MFGGNASKKSQSEIALDFQLSEVTENLHTASEFPADQRAAMSKDLLVTLLMCTPNKSADRQKKLQSIVVYGKDRRQEALSKGATSRDDVFWNTAATIESIAVSQLIALQAGDDRQIAKSINGLVADFIDNNLSSEEIEEISGQIM